MKSYFSFMHGFKAYLWGINKSLFQGAFITPSPQLLPHSAPFSGLILPTRGTGKARIGLIGLAKMLSAHCAHPCSLRPALSLLLLTVV
jgi:hypothetical protein